MNKTQLQHYFKAVEISKRMPVNYYRRIGPDSSFFAANFKGITYVLCDSEDLKDFDKIIKISGKPFRAKESVNPLEI